MNPQFVTSVDELNGWVYFSSYRFNQPMKLFELRALMLELEMAEEKLARSEEIAHEKKLADIRNPKPVLYADPKDVAWKGS